MAKLVDQTHINAIAAALAGIQQLPEQPVAQPSLQTVLDEVKKLETQIGALAAAASPAPAQATVAPPAAASPAPAATAAPVSAVIAAAIAPTPATASH
jgi:hypothetical protein